MQLRTTSLRAIKTESDANGSAPTLPAGALGVWYADQYQASPRPYIPNEINKTTPASANIFLLPRRVSALATMVGPTRSQGGVTISDIAATAGNGAAEASRALAAGDFYFGPGSYTVPAGQYTLACGIKSNTGSAQLIKIGDVGNSVSAAKDVTTSWSRIAHTFTTTGAVSAHMISHNAVTGIDCLFTDLEMFEGATDLGAQPFAGHLYIGESKYSTNFTCTGGKLDLTGGGIGVIQFPSSTSLTQFTALACVKKGAAAADNFHAFLSKIQDYTAFTAYVDLGANDATKMGGPQANACGTNIGQFPGLWRLQSAYQVIGYRYDGTTFDCWYGDVKLAIKTTAGSATAIADLFVGCVVQKIYPSGAIFNSLALYGSALTDAQMRVAVSALQAKAVASSLTLSSGAMLIANGDSITAMAATCYAYLYGPVSTQTQLFGTNIAVSSSGLTEKISREPEIIAKLSASRSGKKNIYSLFVGANDLFGISGSAVTTYATDLLAHMGRIRTAGYKTALGTILPRSDLTAPQNAQHNTNRATVNPIIVAAAGGGSVDAVFNFAADATMGPDAAPSNTANYVDLLHPTPAGQLLLLPIYKTAIDAL